MLRAFPQLEWFGIVQSIHFKHRSIELLSPVDIACCDSPINQSYDGDIAEESTRARSTKDGAERRESRCEEAGSKRRFDQGRFRGGEAFV